MTSNARELAQIPSTPSGRRNMLHHNGAMRVAQRATSATGINSSGYYTVDRVDLALSTTSGEFTQSQVTDAPDGFSHALKFACTNADTSIAAGETTIVMWQLEGQDVQQMAKGTSAAKEVTVSFYAKANASKTYVCELKDFTNTRTVSKTFTVGTSYTRHEITFPADTTGAITSDTAKGFAMNIWLHAGSTYTSGSLQTTWGAQTDANRAVGIDSFFSSTDNTFFITGVQMEVGSVATEFEHRTFGEELAACHRYYKRLGAPRVSSSNFGYVTGASVNANAGQGVIHHHPEMRANPSVEHTGTASDYKIKSQNSNKTCSSTPQFTSNSQQTTTLWFAASGLLTSGFAVHLQNATTDGFVAFEAEL